MKLSTFKSLIESIEQGGKIKKQLSIYRILNETIYKNKDAEFIGYQESRFSEPIALFNVLNIKSNRYQSTVSEKTLKQLNLEIPDYPSFKDWKNNK